MLHRCGNVITALFGSKGAGDCEIAHFTFWCVREIERERPLGEEELDIMTVRVLRGYG